jgi:hypothetical protein
MDEQQAELEAKNEEIAAAGEEADEEAKAA